MVWFPSWQKKEEQLYHSGCSLLRAQSCKVLTASSCHTELAGRAGVFTSLQEVLSTLKDQTLKVNQGNKRRKEGNRERVKG